MANNHVIFDDDDDSDDDDDDDSCDDDCNDDDVEITAASAAADPYHHQQQQESYNNVDERTLTRERMRKLGAVGLGGCFGCLLQGHAYQYCSALYCAICYVPFNDANGHASADCPAFPSTVEEMEKIRWVNGTF